MFNDKGRANQLWIAGDIIANGGIYFGDGLLETRNANTNINFAGLIANDLAQDEETKINDYTSIGSQDQLFNFEAGTDAMHKVFLKTALNVNPADLSSLVLDDPSTYTSGYHVAWADESKRPQIWTLPARASRTSRSRTIFRH